MHQEYDSDDLTLRTLLSSGHKKICIPKKTSTSDYQFRACLELNIDVWPIPQ